MLVEGGAACIKIPKEVIQRGGGPDKITYNCRKWRLLRSIIYNELREDSKGIKFCNKENPKWLKYLGDNAGGIISDFREGTRRYK